MKKKFIKQIEDSIPEGYELAKIDEINQWDVKDIKNAKCLDVAFIAKKKKEKKPKWIKIIENDNTYLPYGHLLKWNGKITDDNCICLTGIDGFAHYIGSNKVVNATKAEIKAHKLGFHVGDEVWSTFTKPFVKYLINDFEYHYGKLYAVMHDDHVCPPMVLIKYLTKQ